MRHSIFLAVIATLMLPLLACTSIGQAITPAPVTAALATADRVTITTEQALIIATQAMTTVEQIIQREVRAGTLHGDDARRVRLVLTQAGEYLDAAHAAQRAGQDAIAAARAGDVIRLVTGLRHDFPALAATLPS